MTSFGVNRPLLIKRVRLQSNKRFYLPFAKVFPKAGCVVAWLPHMNSQLQDLRDQIDCIDAQFLELLRLRLDVVGQISKVKAQQSAPLRDFTREKDCIEKARAKARSLGLPENLAESLLMKVIEASLISQERDRVAAVNDKRKALIVGGFGKMGLWFAHFLESQGFQIEVYDPKATPRAGYAVVSSLEDCNHDVIVVATSLRETDSVLLQLSNARPKGLIFDIASLKGPVRAGLLALATSDLCATSLHPMFGPDTQLLSGRHVILVSLGNPKADNAAKALFAPTMAQVVEMDAQAHDKTVSFLLGLSHALNIVFFTALRQSGEMADRLMALSSTTFDAQLKIAARVAAESPQLYYDIQALNPYHNTSLELFEKAVQQFRLAIDQNNFAEFEALMRLGNAYLTGYQSS